MRTVRKIVVHCADTPDGQDFDAADIHQWHKERGFDGIGYHYVITLAGEVQHGRPEYWPGAHAKGHNSDSIGICLIGRKMFSEPQLKLLRNLIHDIKTRYPHAEVCGHNELTERKTCPNFDVKTWWCKT